MKGLVIAGLCATVLLSCSGAVPPTDTPAPVPTFALSPSWPPMLPDGYVPPGACSTAKREGPWAGATTWTFRCVIGMLDVQGFPQQLRTSASLQGWRECGRDRLFVKHGLAMSLELDLNPPPAAWRPASISPDPRTREVAVIVVQRGQSGSCG